MIRDRLDAHFSTVINEITKGRVIPFLGAGINLCGRGDGVVWQLGQPLLPSGGELAAYLAKALGCLLTDVQDLVRVSQYVDVMNGSGPLYEELRKIFNADYPPTSFHQLLAKLPALLREKGYPYPYQLIVTTNYDDMLERAFQVAREQYEVVSYVAVGEERGKFLHRSADSVVQLIEKPNEYAGLLFDNDGNPRRPVILKIHGAVDRVNQERDSFVITEDHYIDYLTRTDISNLLPAAVAAKLRRSHFLFLGYSLRDWNLRVILHRIWGERKLTYKSWAIQLNPEEFDQKFWMKRDVDILDIRLEDYVSALNDRIRVLPAV